MKKIVVSALAALAVVGVCQAQNPPKPVIPPTPKATTLIIVTEKGAMIANKQTIMVNGQNITVGKLTKTTVNLENAPVSLKTVRYNHMNCPIEWKGVSPSSPGNLYVDKLIIKLSGNKCEKAIVSVKKAA